MVGVSNYQTVRYSNNGNYGYSWGWGWGFGNGNNGENMMTGQTSIDYTETYGTGNLYLGDGPIRDAEVAAARYFSANDCFFLTGGSTQGVLAMLGAAVGRGGSVLIDREVHRSVCHGCALLDITPYFFSAPLLEPFGITGALRVEDAERQLLAHPDIRASCLRFRFR